MADTRKAPAKKAAAKGKGQEKKSEEATLRQAYGQATTKLREAHREEFQRYYKEAAEALGVEYKPRLTPEERAERDLTELLEKFPHLRDKFDESEVQDEDVPDEGDEDDAEVRRFDTVR